MIILGKVRPLSGHLAEPHPQVLIIAPVSVTQLQDGIGMSLVKIC